MFRCWLVIEPWRPVPRSCLQGRPAKLAEIKKNLIRLPGLETAKSGAWPAWLGHCAGKNLLMRPANTDLVGGRCAATAWDVEAIDGLAGLGSQPGAKSEKIYQMK